MCGEKTESTEESILSDIHMRDLVTPSTSTEMTISSLDFTSFCFCYKCKLPQVTISSQFHLNPLTLYKNMWVIEYVIRYQFN